MKSVLFGFILVFVSVLLPAREFLLSDEDVTDLFHSLQEDLSGIETMSVSFTQTRELPMFDDVLVSRGTCFFISGRALRWEYAEPFHSLLIYNQGRVAKYDIMDGKLRRIPQSDDLMGAVMGEILSWMQGDFFSAMDTYNVTVYEQNSFYRLVFEPKSEKFAEFLTSITLNLSAETSRITKVILTGAADDDLVIDFENQQDNIALDERLFDPDNPSLP